MAKYLFTMLDGGGTVPPELAIAKRLVARGHDVRVLADPTIELEARDAGCQFSAWATAPHRTSRAREDDVFRDYEYTSPTEVVGRYVEEFIAKPSPRWIADTLGTIDRHGADAIVTDFMLPATLIAAEARGLASAVVLPNIWMYPTPGIPPMGPGFMPATGPIGLLRDAIAGVIARRVFAKALPHFNDARRSLGLHPVASALSQMQNADRILVLTSPKFDFLSPAMPSHVRYTGPELEDPGWAVPWRSPWREDDARPLVAVGLSSTFQNQVPLLNRIVEALSTLDVRSLVTLGNAIDPAEVKAKGSVAVVATAPHGQIFPQASVVVTHCGHGTTMKGLAAGVPLLCVPMGRDQNDTAARVVHSGAGLRIKPTASARVIRDSVSRLLSEASFREKAGHLARSIAQREGCADAIQALEEIVDATTPRTRRAHPTSAIGGSISASPGATLRAEVV
jgi:MGT family glycosyltransferase